MVSKNISRRDAKTQRKTKAHRRRLENASLITVRCSLFTGSVCLQRWYNWYKEQWSALTYDF